MSRVLNRTSFFAAALAAAALVARAEEAQPMTDEQIVKDVKVPDGFEMTVFARPPMANYPVFVAAAPDGTVYVSSDGNGSLGRDAHRGRILRLRDTNGDGKADEVKEFVKDVDSPRGLVWDHDRIYLIHPPHLSAFVDTNGDGVADKEIVLVKNCGFTFKDRPADHTTNGLELGADGWLYCAQGDFGFMEAEGTDGRKLSFRGGGIWRVRTDGTGLEMYSFGTRNIVGAAIDPQLDLFARDNTNDGGGWDVRYHHFTGLENHGYPMLYINFADEIVPPLADFGGGSGCGDAFVDEPGFATGHYSADWGRGVVYRHENTPKGATFETKPHEFLKMTRPTDVTTDGFSHLYAASWRGATFNWAGPNVGYIVRLSPKGFKPEPMLNPERATDAQLIKLLLSPSAVRRLDAQRALLRRSLKPDVAKVLAVLANDPAKPLASRVAAVGALKQGLGAGATPALVSLTKEPTIRAWAIRALADREDQLAGVPSEPVVAGLRDADPRVKREAAVAAARLGRPENAAAIVPLLGDADVVIAHTAWQALARLKAWKECFAVLDDAKASAPSRANALHALQHMHETAVADGFIARLAKESDAVRRKGLITSLCRLDSVEGKWTGSSWGTRPDTRGPYYQPEKWAETEKIEKALQDALAGAKGEDAAFLLTEFARHRINPGDASAKLIEVASRDETMLPIAVNQIFNAGNAPAGAVPLLIKAARSETVSDDIVSRAVIALAKTEGAEAFEAMLDGFDQLSGGTKKRKGGQPADRAREAFLNAGKLDQHVELYEREAAKLSGKKSLLADAALLKLASRKIGSPEPRQHASEILEKAWNDPKRRVQILDAAALADAHYNFAKIIAALDDPDPAVAKAANNAARDLKIDPDKFKAAARAGGQKISGMKPDEIIATVMTMKGDASRGPQLFTQQGCVACHTTGKGEPLKGPYLGNIASIYKRRELAENILLPNRTIAQGFVTWSVTLKDGTAQVGFITEEAADSITLRNITAQEIRIPTANIAKRDKLPMSLMPEQLVATLTLEDFASLLDYLEQLAKNEK